MTSYELAVYIFSGLAGAALFVFVFLPAKDQSEAVEKTRLAYLHERKDVIYENLRDLNFEHKSGKFTEADFDSMRNNMEAEAARVLAEIDKLEKAAAS